MVNSEEVRKGISYALKVMNIKGKYRLLPAIIDKKMIKVLSIYLHGYQITFFTQI